MLANLSSLPVAVLTLSLLEVPAVGRLPLRPPAPAGRLVAEATIHALDGSGAKVLLPVRVQGQALTVMLDVGTVENIVSPTVLAQVGIARTGVLDTLILGTAVEHQVSVKYADWSASASPQGWPPVVGLLGTSVLSHYDLVFDGPAQRVRLYVPPPPVPGSGAAPRAPWLPEGFTPSECVPLLDRGLQAPGIVGLQLHANGRALLSIFDSGMAWTVMNLPAARVLGITKHWPGIHLLPPDSSVGYPGARNQKNYRVPGVRITVGAQALRAHAVYVFQRIPEYFSEAIPELDFGLEAVRDRKVLVSYSTHQVCLGPPQQAGGGMPGHARAAPRSW